jgi:hypothetical protein
LRHPSKVSRELYTEEQKEGKPSVRNFRKKCEKNLGTAEKPLSGFFIIG